MKRFPADVEKKLRLTNAQKFFAINSRDSLFCLLNNSNNRGVANYPEPLRVYFFNENTGK